MNANPRTVASRTIEESVTPCQLLWSRLEVALRTMALVERGPGLLDQEGGTGPLTEEGPVLAVVPSKGGTATLP